MEGGRNDGTDGTDGGRDERTADGRTADGRTDGRQMDGKNGRDGHKFGGARGQPICDDTCEGSFISQTPDGKSDNIQCDSSQRVYKSVWRYASSSMCVIF